MLAAVTLDALAPKGHSIRRIKPMVDKALNQLFPTFNRMCADHGRASIPPEHLLKAGLLMALFSVRTARHEGYRLSQRARKRIEEVFGWVKTVGGGRMLRYCGVARNRLWTELT